MPRRRGRDFLPKKFGARAPGRQPRFRAAAIERGRPGVPMSLRADSLRSLGFSSKALEAVVKEQLRIIDNQLQASDKRLGWNIMKYQLPDSFPVPGIEDPAEQQRFIYSRIVVSLTERGFTAKLWLTDPVSYVLIGYLISYSEDQVSAMNAVLSRACLNDNSELDRFIDGTWSRAGEPERARDDASEASGGP